MITEWFLLWLAVLLPLTVAESCSDTGEWAAWSEWSTCPASSSSVMNFKSRLRQCEARPVGCEQTQAYSCPGAYSEVTYCTTTTSTTTLATPTTFTTTTTTTARATTQPVSTSVPPTTLEETTMISTTARATTNPVTTEALTTDAATSEKGTTAAATTNAASTEVPSTESATSKKGTTGAASTTAAISEAATTESATTAVPSTNAATSDGGSSPAATTAAPSTSPASTSEATTNAGTSDASTAESSTTMSGSSDGSTAASTPDGSTSADSSTSAGQSTSAAATDASSTTDGAILGDPSTTSSETTEVTDVSTDVTDSTGTGETQETTTMGFAVTCDDCNPLNVFLFNSDPYEDGASVLNRYTASGCRYVQFFCRPVQTGDTRSVRTIYNEDAEMTGLPLNLNLACQNGEWLAQGHDTIVTSLSCVYHLPATTSEPASSEPTTPTEPTQPTPTTSTTFIPGIDLNNPCMNCSYLIVSPPDSKEGVTYLDHQLDACLNVDVYCMPSIQGSLVELAYNADSETFTGSSVNKTFQCNLESDWIDSTGAVVDSVSCAMIESGTTSSGSNAPSTDGSSESTIAPTTLGSDTSTYTSEGSTTPSGSSPESTTVSHSGGSTSETAQSTDGSTDSSSSTSGSSLTSDQVTGTATGSTMTNTSPPGTSTNPSTTDAEAGVSATGTSSESQSTSDDVTGTTSTSDSSVEATATTAPGTTSSQTSEPVSESSTVAPNTGSTDGSTSTGNTGTTNTASSEGSSTSGVVTTESTSTVTNGAGSDTTGTTFHTTVTDSPSGTTGITKDPKNWNGTAEGCGYCSTMSAQPVNRDDCYNGMMVLDHYADENGECLYLDIDCRPKSESENTTVLFDESMVASTGFGSAQLTLVCSSDNQWKWDDTPVTSVSCMVQRSLVTTGPETVSVTTPTAVPPTTTTVDPGTASCLTCPRLNVVETSGTNGLTTLFNSNDGLCSVVNVTCKAFAMSDEVLLLSNEDPIGLGTGELSMKLTCDDSATWRTSEGNPVTDMSCHVAALSNNSGVIHVSTSTANPVNLCGNCPNMVAQPLEIDGFYNGMLVLDHYTDGDNCRMLDIDCRPNSESENTTILLDFGTVVATGLGQKSILVTCSSEGNWLYEEYSGTTASCMIQRRTSAEVLPTTTTIPPPPTTPTTVPPGTDPCTACSRIQVGSVSASDYINGFTTLFNGFKDGCRMVQVSCEGYLADDSVTLMSDELEMLTGLGEVTMNLTCDQTASWTSSTGETVPQIACAIQQDVPTTTVSTTTLSTVTTTVSSTTATTPQTSTTTSVPTTATTTISFGACGNCPNMVAKPMELDGFYNGMMILDHFTDENNCRRLDVECRPQTSIENTTILANEVTTAVTGPGQHSLSLTCSFDGDWQVEGQPTSSVSCMVQRAQGPLPPTVPTVATTPSGSATTTTLAPGTNPCSACQRIQVNSCSPDYADGFTTLFNSNVGGCRTVQMLCEGNTPTDDLALMMSGTELLQGTEKLSLNLTCNEMTAWETADGIVVPNIGCGIIQALPTTTSTTTLETTTTTIAVTTTTAIPTTTGEPVCHTCSNLNPVEPLNLGENQDAGTLVVEHFFDAQTDCRIVVIRCQGTSSENMTVILNDDIEVASSPNQISISLACDSDGTWSRQGQQITSAACRATLLQDSVITSATEAPTTPIPTTTAAGSAACANCNRRLITSVPTGYSSGLLSMDTHTTGTSQCIGVDLTCLAPTVGQQISLLGADNSPIAEAETRVNMSLTCNELAQWVTSAGSPVSTLSCGTVRAVVFTDASTTTATAAPTTTTTASCSQSVWEEWRAWSDCTATCGSCGTHQRFRACNKSDPSCLCPGTAYEKVYCNTAVCKYPASSACCDGFRPTSVDGQFQCMPTT